MQSPWCPPWTAWIVKPSSRQAVEIAVKPCRRQRSTATAGQQDSRTAADVVPDESKSTHANKTASKIQLVEINARARPYPAI